MKRVLWGFAVALAITLSAYLLFSHSKASNVWFASLWFLVLLPALLCVLICYIGDPDQERPAAFYWWIPPALTGTVDVGSALFLHEGVICLIMITPIWIASGWAGAFLFRSLRKDAMNRNTFLSFVKLVKTLSIF